MLASLTLQDAGAKGRNSKKPALDTVEGNTAPLPRPAPNLNSAQKPSLAEYFVASDSARPPMGAPGLPSAGRQLSRHRTAGRKAEWAGQSGAGRGAAGRGAAAAACFATPGSICKSVFGVVGPRWARAS